MIDVQALLPQVLDALVTAGILHSKEDLLFADLREIDYAYVVFDDNYYPALAALVPFWKQTESIRVGDTDLGLTTRWKTA